MGKRCLPSSGDVSVLCFHSDQPGRARVSMYNEGSLSSHSNKRRPDLCSVSIKERAETCQRLCGMGSVNFLAKEFDVRHSVQMKGRGRKRARKPIKRRICTRPFRLSYASCTYCTRTYSRCCRSNGRAGTDTESLNTSIG